jgi:hypothetical protein
MRCARLIPAIAAFMTSAVFAQQITLFENDNFNGRRFTATDSVQSLLYHGFNDAASSAIIRGGSWQVCTDAYFRGRCVTLGPGNYASLGQMGLNDRVSSVREISWGGGGGGSGGGTGGGSAGPIGPGGPALVFYDGYNLQGRQFAISTPLNNFEGTGFNDRAVSAEVRDGTWQLCSDANFQGNCVEIGPGRYPNLSTISGKVSSARPIASGGGGAGGGHGGGGWGGGRTRVVLYERPNFGGASYPLPSNYIANFENTGFNDRTSSIRVERGYWLLCSEAGFQGDCRTLGPGDYATLPYGLNNRISSARRISEDYPYSSPPNWSR